jgi:hypothetical protein
VAGPALSRPERQAIRQGVARRSSSLFCWDCFTPSCSERRHIYIFSSKENRASSGNPRTARKSWTKRRGWSIARDSGTRCHCTCLQCHRGRGPGNHRARDHCVWHRGNISRATEYSNANECCDWCGPCKVCFRYCHIPIRTGCRMPLTTRFEWLDIIAPPLAAIGWLLISWLYARAVSLGRPLSAVQKGMIIYGFIFVLGMGYLIMMGGALHWQKTAIFPCIGIWAGAVGLLAWSRKWGRTLHKR